MSWQKDTSVEISRACSSFGWIPDHKSDVPETTQKKKKRQATQYTQAHLSDGPAKHRCFPSTNVRRYSCCGTHERWLVAACRCPEHLRSHRRILGLRSPLISSCIVPDYGTFTFINAPHCRFNISPKIVESYHQAQKLCFLEPLITDFNVMGWWKNSWFV